MTPLLLALGVAQATDLVGRVTDHRGLPLEAVLVLAYDDRVNYEYDYTLPDGTFRIDDLEATPRRVRFLSPDVTDAVEMYFGGAPKLCKGDVVELPARGVLDLGTVVMLPGGVVRGQVLGVDGAPVVGAEVVARPAGVTPIAVARGVFTDDQGRFDLRGIPVEADGTSWNFEVIPPTSPEQFLGPSFGAETAAVFEVAVGAPLDVGSWTLLPGGSLSGTAVGPEGPLAEGTVWAVTVGRTWSAPVVDGAWEIPALPPGEARVWITAPGHATTYWPDATVPGGTVPVVDAEATEDVALSLDAEAIVSGRLVWEGDLTGSTITLVDPTRAVQVTAAIEPDGRFAVGALGSGRWLLEVTPGEQITHVWGPLLTSEGNLLEIALEPGEPLDLGEIPLPAGAAVKGVARDRVTGEPIYGAWIYVENASTGTTRLAITGKQGRYEAQRLPAGVYRVHAQYEPYCRGDRDWVSRHYPDQRNGVLTGTLPLAAGQVVHWRPELPFDVDQDNMGDGWEATFGLRVGKKDATDDLDGDGFNNLDEYLLGTDPADGKGCDGCAGGGGWLFLLPLVALPGRRRARGR